MLDHKKNLLSAIQMSQFSIDNGSSPFGCVIVENSTGKIITQAHNRVVLDNDPTAHAEIVAIRTACKNLNSFDLSSCTLYSSCEPCPMCLNACKWSNIAEIYYAANRVDAESIGFRDKIFYESSPIKIYQIDSLKDEASLIMNHWYKKQDKIPY